MSMNSNTRPATTNTANNNNNPTTAEEFGDFDGDDDNFGDFADFEENSSTTTTASGTAVASTGPGEQSHSLSSLVAAELASLSKHWLAAMKVGIFQARTHYTHSHIHRVNYKILNTLNFYYHHHKINHSTKFNQLYYRVTHKTRTTLTFLQSQFCFQIKLLYTFLPNGSKFTKKRFWYLILPHS